MSGSVSGSGSAEAANDLSLVLLFQLSPYGCSHAACLPQLFGSLRLLISIVRKKLLKVIHFFTVTESGAKSGHVLHVLVQKM